jgi:Putative Actinobacterial Holin-X, holin superfamily III
VATTQSYGGNGRPLDEQSLGELVATATRDMSLLVHQEVELAKTELAEQVGRAGVGAGLFGGAGFLALIALILASFAGAYGFTDGLDIPIWAGFLCMTGVYVLLAGALALVGRSWFNKVSGPELTERTVKESLAWARHPRQKPATTRAGTTATANGSGPTSPAGTVSPSGPASPTA